MKSFSDLLNFARENGLGSRTKVRVAYRESAYFDMQYLILAVTGNGLYATDNAEGRSVQCTTDTIGHISQLRELHERNQAKRVISIVPELFAGNIEPSLWLGNTFLTGGSEVINFIIEDDTIVLDTKFIMIGS
ncbi:hypothetical protein SP15_072 [Bacillus phage SP-15]|uniref:Uncharacterized protein n=1 Tax=Bacillus phage SP-15 TaxID=1792032 RepID=A0A127AYQ5_9CAUD|nr:hypothetical protein SP15_072 [Bacillus phage SP-15]AMM44871.1 hypothetical protein SP15_072 [Bacillus phage SP-15]